MMTRRGGSVTDLDVAELRIGTFTGRMLVWRTVTASPVIPVPLDEAVALVAFEQACLHRTMTLEAITVGERAILVQRTPNSALLFRHMPPQAIMTRLSPKSIGTDEVIYGSARSG